MAFRMMAAFLLMVMLSGGQVRAETTSADVDLLLCLAADASESVSEFEYYLQRQGHADAIEDDEVVQAVRSGSHGRIAVTYMEWAKPDQQFLGVDWQVIDGIETAREMARKIRAAPSPPWIRFNVRDTSTGDAIRYCLKRFDAAPVGATRRIIDISSNGTSNAGGQISHARDMALDRGVVINVLAIARPIEVAHPFEHTRPQGGLVNYFARNVAGGNGSFVEPASNYGSFAAMIRRKFLTEIAGR